MPDENTAFNRKFIREALQKQREERSKRDAYLAERDAEYERLFPNNKPKHIKRWY